MAKCNMMATRYLFFSAASKEEFARDAKALRARLLK